MLSATASKPGSLVLIARPFQNEVNLRLELETLI